uniref:Transmembrane protein 101 n=1 Tax=Ovis aries TaxID=9940 RepID=A0AC11EFT5_SHEEP
MKQGMKRLAFGRPGYKPHMKRTELRRLQPHLQQSSPSDSSGLPSPDHPASGAVAMMAGRRSWPAMAIVLLALLVCLGELVDADSKPQPSGEKASWEKHHFSLSHYAKLANRLVDPKLLGSFLSKRISDHANRPVK